MVTVIFLLLFFVFLFLFLLLRLVCAISSLLFFYDFVTFFDGFELLFTRCKLLLFRSSKGGFLLLLGFQSCFLHLFVLL